MQASRVVAVESPTQRGSGYVIGPQLVLTSAHVTGDIGMTVTLFALGDAASCSAVVVWSGTPGGRDDAALLHVDDPSWRLREDIPPRWGRVITNRPGIACETWGFPAWVQRPDQAADSWQPSGTLNPGNRYIADRYVMGIVSYPPAAAGNESPWGGLSGAALFCGDLLTGVVAVDPAGGQHAYLEAVPTYMLHRNEGFRQVLADHGFTELMLEPVETQLLAEAEPPVGNSPAALLRARQQVVAFRGREQVMQQLYAWSQALGLPRCCCTAPAGRARPASRRNWLADWPPSSGRHCGCRAARPPMPSTCSPTPKCRYC